MSQQDPSYEQATTYAKAFIKHGVQSDAFREAFPESKALPENIHAKSSNFHKIDKVQTRIKEFQETVKKKDEEEFHVSTNDIRMLLHKAVGLGMQTKFDSQGNEIAHSINGAVTALNELNKMYGNHAATKHQIGGDNSLPPIRVENFPVDPVDASKAYEETVKGNG